MDDGRFDLHATNAVAFLEITVRVPGSEPHILRIRPGESVDYGGSRFRWDGDRLYMTSLRPPLELYSSRLQDNWVDAPLTVENGRPVTARHLVDEGRFL